MLELRSLDSGVEYVYIPVGSKSGDVRAFMNSKGVYIYNTEDADIVDSLPKRCKTAVVLELDDVFGENVRTVHLYGETSANYTKVEKIYGNGYFLDIFEEETEAKLIVVEEHTVESFCESLVSDLEAKSELPYDTISMMKKELESMVKFGYEWADSLLGKFVKYGSN